MGKQVQQQQQNNKQSKQIQQKNPQSPKKKSTTELKKKSGNSQKIDIDDLFNKIKVDKQIKKDKQTTVQSDKKLKQQKDKPKQQKIDKSLPIDNINNDRKGGPRRKTSEGYEVYTYDELNIGKGGDTPDCPFDCKCCY